VRTDGSVWCWGRNDSGQLGDETTQNRSNPVAVVELEGVRVSALALGSAHTCALVDDGTVRCWGDGGGRLGNGSTNGSTTPVEVSDISTATAISAGNDHTCALLADGTVRCWGNNSEGQLGDPNVTDFSSSTALTVRTTATGIALDNVTAISAGTSHTCAIVGTGRNMWCWGFNSFGQLANPNVIDSSSSTAVQVLTDSTTALAGVSSVSAGSAHTCAILSDPDEFLCWGGNSSGQLGDGTTTSPRLLPVAVSGSPQTVPVAVSAGAEHTCDLLDAGTVRCWGRGDDGQLGLGDANDRNTPVDVPDLSGVAMVSSGGFHTCALMDDDTVRCWGDGSSGRLGDGTTDQRTSPVTVLASGTAAAFSVRPQTEAPRTPAPSGPSVSCTPAAGPITVGSEVTCTVTGGDPGIDILWRAAVNPVIAEAGVTLDADGRGTFALTVPASALGATLTVELVAWTAPVAIGVVGTGGPAAGGGPVPTGVPAGEGPWPGGAALVVLLALSGMLVVAGARSSSAGRR